MTFPANSRYAATEIAKLVRGDGSEVAYLRRRFVPTPETLAVQRQHAVVEGDRLDNLAATYLGDPELFWQIADANRAMRPEELVATVGARLDIALPSGFSGGALV